MKRLKSGIKRARQSKKRKARNLKTKEALRKAIKTARRAITGKAAEAKELAIKAVSLLDKAAERGIIHKNQASRKKSRLFIMFNKSSA